MKTDTLTVKWVALARLHLNPANPRHNDAAVPHVVASIRRFGWRQPIVARRSGEVIAGNTRLKAAQSMGLERVPVTWFEGPNLEAVAYGIADNKTNESATWDEPALARLLDELRSEDAFDAVGFSPDEIDDLLQRLDEETGAGNEADDPGPGAPPGLGRIPVERRVSSRIGEQGWAPHEHGGLYPNVA